jgi:uncharacterized protein (DUF1501 family)
MPDATRRAFLQFGLSAFGSMSLAELYRLRAATKPITTRERTAIIIVWLRGGGSHLDTYDPKPDASSDYRGPFSTLQTKTTGLRITELLPLHAKISNRFTILRSMAHTGGGHPAGSLQLLSGDPDPQDKLKPIFPDLMSVAHRLRFDPNRAIPNYVGVNPIVRYDNFTIAGPAYLGEAYSPFAVMGDPNAPHFRVPNIGLANPDERGRFAGRLQLLSNLNSLRHDVDRTRPTEGMDSYQEQAINLLTSPGAEKAFDLNRENPKIRDRYGRNAWGQQLLMARRLVEAGVEIVTTELSGPLCGRVQNWDDHAVNHHVFAALKFRAPPFDQAVSALVEDIYDRGLDKRVLVVVTGEFGRTPKISYVASSGPGVASAAEGTVQPGRDHWPSANSMLWAGGGIPTGRVIGATDRLGETVVDRRVGPQDFLATIYHHLGIDYENVTLPDQTGRPYHIVQGGKAIPELIKA